MAFSIQAVKIKSDNNIIYYKYTGRDQKFGFFSISVNSLSMIESQLADNDPKGTFLTKILTKIAVYAKEHNYTEFPDEIWYQA